MDSNQLPAVLTGIFFPYLVAGTVDFTLKEVTKRRLFARGGLWSDMPRWLLHEHRWHIFITALWMLPQLILVLVFGWPWQIILGWLVFYTEDTVYYLLTRIVYGGPHEGGRIFPPQLHWLHGNIGWYKRIVGESFPRKNFLRILALQYLLLAIALLLA
ncbi:MAG: hypothetical protein M5R41_09950 [Bacteroidia bacterium]|nr:hypothetical protein [Bacteroidia bacterium]